MKSSNTSFVYLVNVHEPFQSIMNQEYTFKSLKEVQPNQYVLYYFTPIIEIKAKTKHYQCDENNAIKLNPSFDEFYMAKMNCSFPWLSSYNGTLQKCGSKHYIQDFSKLIASVSHGRKKYENELTYHGCNIPNCMTTNWKMVNSEIYDSKANNSTTSLHYGFFHDSNVHS